MIPLDLSGIPATDNPLKSLSTAPESSVSAHQHQRPADTAAVETYCSVHCVACKTHR